MGPQWGEPRQQRCKGCRRPILQHQSSVTVHFPEGSGTEDMTGNYHADCARTFGSIANALDMLGRVRF